MLAAWIAASWAMVAMPLTVTDAPGVINVLAMPLTTSLAAVSVMMLAVSVPLGSAVWMAVSWAIVTAVVTVTATPGFTNALSAVPETPNKLAAVSPMVVTVSVADATRCWIAVSWETVAVVLTMMFWLTSKVAPAAVRVARLAALSESVRLCVPMRDNSVVTAAGVPSAAWVASTCATVRVPVTTN